MVWVFGAPPQNPTIFWQFKHPHHRYPSTPLLAYKVQSYGCLGPHPRTQTVFGIVPFNHHHLRYSETPLLASGVQWYGCLGRHPRSPLFTFDATKTCQMTAYPTPYHRPISAIEGLTAVALAWGYFWGVPGLHTFFLQVFRPPPKFGSNLVKKMTHGITKHFIPPS